MVHIQDVHLHGQSMDVDFRDISIPLYSLASFQFSEKQRDPFFFDLLDSEIRDLLRAEELLEEIRYYLYHTLTIHQPSTEIARRAYWRIIASVIRQGGHISLCRALDKAVQEEWEHSLDSVIEANENHRLSTNQ